MKTLYQWSLEDYHRIIETGILSDRAVELLEGEIVQMSPEGPLHTFTNHEIAKYLRQLLDGLAEVREAHPITLDNSEPEPDLAVVHLPNTNYITHHPYPPEIYLLIEISNSTLTDDLERKKQIYARNGIAEYWVIDLQNRKLWVFRNPENNNYLKVTEVKIGTIDLVTFPNIAIDVNKLLINF
jgi:Uma2 family endonuclease